MSNDSKAAFAGNIRWWIETTGRKQVWVAERCGVTPGTVKKWMNGAIPVQGDHLDKLAKLMGVPAWLLLVRDGVKNKDSILRAVANLGME